MTDKVINWLAVGEKLKAARKKKGLSTLTVAASMGWSGPRTMCDIERGYRQVKFEEIADLEEILGIEDLFELITGLTKHKKNLSYVPSIRWKYEKHHTCDMAELNRLGLLGWEVCAAYKTESGQRGFLMKKQLP